MPGSGFFVGFGPGHQAALTATPARAQQAIRAPVPFPCPHRAHDSEGQGNDHILRAL